MILTVLIQLPRVLEQVGRGGAQIGHARAERRGEEDGTVQAGQPTLLAHLQGLLRAAVLFAVSGYCMCIGLLAHYELTRDEHAKATPQQISERGRERFLWLLTGGVTLTLGYSYTSRFTPVLFGLFVKLTSLQPSVVWSLLLTVCSLGLGAFSLHEGLIDAFTWVCLYGGMTISTLVAPLWFMSGVSRDALEQELMLPSDLLIFVGMATVLYGAVSLANAAFCEDEDCEATETDV